LHREQWNSQLGFVFAAAGSAVGLGNIWRFSYMAYNYGGGAFLIPYIIALLSAGIPLLILEITLGHERMGSAPLAFAKINKNWEWVGWWAVIFVMFGIVLYYAVIIAWCLNFFFLSFYLGWGDDPNKFFFHNFLAISKSPSELGHIRMPILLALSVVWLLNWGIVFRGVRRGIERINKIFMPLLFFLTMILVLWSLSLDGSMTGLKAYLKPDFSKLFNVAVWIDAYSQVFFSLSLGFGIIIAYASYLPRKANITKNAILTVFIDSGYAIFAGIAVFSVLGFMATSEGKSVSEVVSQSIGLAFVAYPKAVSLIPGGNIFGSIFFFCLFLAGLSSSISIIEAFISAAIDKFGFKREPLITLVTFIGFCSSIIFTTQAGLLWLDIADHFITHYGLIVVGIAECLLVGWLFNIKILREHINSISTIKVGYGWDILIKYFVPFVLGVILLGDLCGEIRQPYGGYSWTALVLIGWNWILLTIIVAFLFAKRKWKNRYYEIEEKL
jgi:NSS family neurotransmitter:Na+ symporter